MTKKKNDQQYYNYKEWLMKNDLEMTTASTSIEERIFNIRGKQVMIDKDLGKKWFGFTLLENTDAEELLRRM